MLFIINDNIRSPPLHSIKNSCTQSTHDCLCPGQVVQRMDKAGEMKAWRHQGEWDRAALGTAQPELHPLDARYEALTHDPRSLSKTPSKTQLNPLPQMPISGICREQWSADQRLLLCHTTSERIPWSPSSETPASPHGWWPRGREQLVDAVSWRAVPHTQAFQTGSFTVLHSWAVLLLAKLAHSEPVRYLSKQVLLSYRWASFIHALSPPRALYVLQQVLDLGWCIVTQGVTEQRQLRLSCGHEQSRLTQTCQRLQS